MEPHPPIIEPPQKKDTSWHNTIANYMSRHVRHIRAKSNEWYQIHRGSGGGASGGGAGGGGDWNPWVKMIGFLMCCWLVYVVVSYVIALIQAVVSAILGFLVVVVPVVAVIMVVIGMVWYLGSK